MGYLPYDVNIKTIVWIFVLIYFGIISSFLFFRSFKSEMKSLKEMQRAISFFIFMAITHRIFFIFSDYERDNYGNSVLYYQFVIIAYICLIIGILSVIYVLEKHVIKKTKFLFTYIVLIFLVINIIMFFIPNIITIVRYINYSLVYFLVILVLLIYLYIIINSSDKVRIKSMIIFLALIILMVGALLDSDPLIMSGISTPFYCPILFAIGITLFFYVQIKD